MCGDTINSNVKKFLSPLFAVFAICLVLPLLGLAAPSPAVCGAPFDTNATSSDGFIWDATTFGGFNFPVNQYKDFVSSDNWRGERLQYIEKDGEDELGKNNPGNHVIGEEELVYSTRQYSSKYTLVSELNLNPGTTPEKLGGMFYHRLALFGKPYIAIENDARQLANIVISQSGSDKKTLKTGEAWDLRKGYSLTVNQVDVEGNKVWFSLSKNGEVLESVIVEADGTVENQAFIATADFGNGKDQLYFITYVDSVFTSATDSIAVFKYTWLIDKEDVKIIKTGDEYQGFKVKEASKDGIVLKNSKEITLELDKNKKNYFTDSWYFQTSDEGKGSTSPAGYIICPATDIVIEDNTAIEFAGNNSPADNNNTIADNNNTIADNNSAAEETDITDVVLHSNESESISPYYRSAPFPTSEMASEVSEGSNNHPEEGTGEESQAKLPGFGIVSGIFGVIVCTAFRGRINP